MNKVQGVGVLFGNSYFVFRAVDTTVQLVHVETVAQCEQLHGVLPVSTWHIVKPYIDERFRRELKQHNLPVVRLKLGIKIDHILGKLAKVLIAAIENEQDRVVLERAADRWLWMDTEELLWLQLRLIDRRWRQAIRVLFCAE